jgi:hypothetical protein
MSISPVLPPARAMLMMVAAFLCLSGFGLCQTTAAEHSFQVQLVWGTDGQNPKDEPLKNVEPKLQEKLKGVFKWKNYFEVTTKPLTVNKSGAQKLKLSDKCDIQVKDAGGSRIEIHLYGEGKLVLRKVQTVTPGEVIVLAGDSKNDTAWFVVMTPAK